LRLMRSSDQNIVVSRAAHLRFMTVTFCYWFSMYIYVPILTPYLSSLGATYTFVGIVLASYGFMQLLLRLPIGIMSDFLQGRRPFVILGMLTAVASCFLFALTEQAGWALVSRALSGITASTWVVMTVLYSSYYATEQVTQAMSTIQFVTVFTQLCSMGLSGYLTEEWGWHSTFWVGGFVAVAGLLLSVSLPEKISQNVRNPIRFHELATVIKEPLLQKASLLSIFAHSILFITMFGFTPHYALLIGASKTELTWLIFSFMIPHATASLLAGKYFVSRYGRWRTLHAGFIGSALFTFCIPFIHQFSLLCFVQMFNGFTLGLIFPVLMGMAIHPFPQEKHATAMGFYQAVYSVGMVAGPFLAGWISSFSGVEEGFVLGGVLGTAGVWMILRWTRQERKMSLGEAQPNTKI
jgi:MFS transporter, DHA1 family, multidrug resistance protein